MSKVKMNRNRRWTASQIFLVLLILLFTLGCFLPMYLVVINSFADEAAILRDGYLLLPSKFSLSAYRAMFYEGSSIYRSYAITVGITAIGTVIAVIITYMCGFVLANKRLKYRNHFALFFFITTVFNPGLVPWYMICRLLGLYNNIWALIIPSLIFSPFNMFLVRNYINGVPFELLESGQIDGAGSLRIVFQIYLPVCTPVVATIGLFYALGYWNSYFNAVMLVDDSSLYPLQMMLFQIQSNLNMLRELTSVSVSSKDIPTESFKMAAAVATTGPIVLLYPFLQRYFAKGLVIGAVKG